MPNISKFLWLILIWLLCLEEFGSRPNWVFSLELPMALLLNGMVVQQISWALQNSFSRSFCFMSRETPSMGSAIRLIGIRDIIPTLSLIRGRHFSLVGNGRNSVRCYTWLKWFVPGLWYTAWSRWTRRGSWSNSGQSTKYPTFTFREFLREFLGYSSFRSLVKPASQSPHSSFWAERI